MKRKLFAASGVFFALLLFSLSARPQAAQSQQQGDQPNYTVAEYNAYQAAAKETNPQQRIALLDDFVAKFPNSSLLRYIYLLEYQSYGQLKNYPKTIAYIDKLLALRDKIDTETRLAALYARAQAYYLGQSDKSLTTPEQLAAARDAAQQGLQAFEVWKKPAQLTDDQFNQQKKSASILFDNVLGVTDTQLKDYKAAAGAYKAALALDPSEALTYYRLGVAYLAQEPPQAMDGFWAVARAIALKGPGEAQIRDYLRKRMLVYQQPGCDNLIDAQMNELIQLATNSPERPATYAIPSATDLDSARKQSTILTVLTDLSSGGDKAKITWLSICGSDFPEVVGKIIQATPGPDSVDFKVYTGATEDEMQNATTANMDVNVTGQPDVKRLQKDDAIRFAGTLVSYDAQPFTLRWDKVKVDRTIIPEEKASGTHKPHRIPKKPAG